MRNEINIAFARSINGRNTDVFYRSYFGKIAYEERVKKDIKKLNNGRIQKKVRG